MVLQKVARNVIAKTMIASRQSTSTCFCPQRSRAPILVAGARMMKPYRQARPMKDMLLLSDILCCPCDQAIGSSTVASSRVTACTLRRQNYEDKFKDRISVLWICPIQNVHILVVLSLGKESLAQRFQPTYSIQAHCARLGATSGLPKNKKLHEAISWCGVFQTAVWHGTYE